MLERLRQAFQDMFDGAAELAPKVAVGLALLLVGVLVAKVIEWVLRAVLTRLRFDDLMKRAGIDKALQRIGIRQQLNQFLPRLAYFLLLFLIAKTTADALGLVAISEALGSFFAYLPNLVAALLLLLIGSAASQFAAGAVTEAAGNSGIEFARPLGRLVGSVVFFIVAIMAFGQLKIDTEIIHLVTALFLAGAALAFGLSFGLGSRDVTRNILAGFYARKIFTVGEPVEIAGERGTLRSVTPTHALIETEDRTIRMANGRFLDEIARQ